LLRRQFLLLVGKFDHQIEKHGVQTAMRRFVAWNRTRLVTVGLTPDVRRILTHEAVVVTINHPYEYEVFAVGAVLPYRRTVTVLANAMFFDLGKNLNQILIPLYLSRRQAKVNLMGRLFNLVLPMPSLPEAEEKQRNGAALKFATKRLQAGHMLFIAPDRRSPDGRWLPGVGRVLSQTKRRVFVAMVHTEGISAWDYLRFLPLVGRFLPPLSVNFAPPYLLNPFGQDPYLLTAKMEETYHDWLSGEELAEEKNLELVGS
jgi:hypothetical protein